MEKIKLFMILSLLLAFTSCEKLAHKDNTKYIISGYLYEDCGIQPVKNQELSLFQTIEVNNLTGSSAGGELATTTTDGNGYFKFEYKNDGSETMTIRYKAGAGYNSIMQEIPRKLNKNDFRLYKNPQPILLLI